MRAVWDAHGRAFDVVLCADNALPHLLADDDILHALRGFRRCTAPGGICLVSVREYEAIDLQTQRLHPHGVREADGARWVLLPGVGPAIRRCTRRRCTWWRTAARTPWRRG